jgi:5-methyltetrahydrofolate--homocysteine methyltransferase
MSIAFSAERWEQTKRNYDLWWAGKLQRPLMPVYLKGRDGGRREPAVPRASRTGLYPLSVTPEQIVDRWDYELSCVEFLGDAFPSVWIDFGPGIVAGFLGCEVTPGVDTLWFHPRKVESIDQLRFRYDGDNIWLKRVKDIARAAVARWGGSVQVAMTDLGGNLDILASFRPSENLLLDLYDHPEEVKRLTWEAHELWFRYFDEINAILRPTNPGYTTWANIFCSRPTYMLQCDFAYMIGPGMFDEFVQPELAAACGRLDYAFYHLDGQGQLPHLDSLLSIDALKGVQWVPGDGSPPCRCWADVYRRIRKAGKLVQYIAGPEGIEPVAEACGGLKGFVLQGLWRDASQRREVEATLKRWGVV